MANARSQHSRRPSEPRSPAVPTPGADNCSEILASWKTIQTNTFVRWANEHLREAGGDPVVDLAVDFSDGVRLITLVESLSRRKFPRRYSRQPGRRNQRLENVTLVLEFLEHEEKIRLVNIDSSDIVDGNVKLILGLMWSLILHYSISDQTWDEGTGASLERKKELTPKQRLLSWIKNKLPQQDITNFTSDWIDGRNIGALVDSIAPGLCPDWHLWKSGNALENARKAMTVAEEWLNIPQLITPGELTDPKLDELSAMTYLAQFPSARPKSSICIRRSGACAVGPGVVGLPLEFSIDSLDEDDISNAIVKIVDSAGFEKQFDMIPTGNTKSLVILFKPETEGAHKVTVNLYGAHKMSENVLAFDVKGTVIAVGPGLEPNHVALLQKTYFEVQTDNVKVKDMEVTIVQPESVDKSLLCSDICKTTGGHWRVEYTPLVEGLHTVSLLVNGGVICGSPYSVFVSSSESSNSISMKGRGIQPSGLRVGDDAVVVLQVDDIYAVPKKHKAISSKDENNQQSKLDLSDLEVSISDPDGTEVHGTSQQQGSQLKYTYKPEKVGKFVGAATYKGQNINGSPFVVNVNPAVVRKSRVFGPGLHSGIVGHRACFTVDRHQDENLTGICVDGPQSVEVEITDNEDGSKDVSYVPLIPGEYAVHIFCNNDEDIPGSPFMVDVTTAPDDFDPTKVLAYGNGLSDSGITVDEWTEFTLDTTLAGQDAELFIEAYNDEYNEVKVLMDESSKAGAVECRYKPQKTGQHRLFISYGGVNINERPYRVQVHDNPASYPVVELPVEATQVGHVSSHLDILDDDDESLDYQALRVKAYGDGLGSGFAGHPSSFIVVMSDCSVECLGVAVDGPCKVEMDCFETKEGYKFSYIPRTAGEFIVSINYAGKYPIPGSPFHVYVKEATNLYSVRVYTGNKLFAGTDANVYITLFGEIGDTGTVQLKASRTHLNKFERNQMDEFFVEAVNIGELRKIKIGHDNAGKVGTSWFLDRVEIDSPLLGKHWVFPFRRWLSKGDLSVEMVATVVNDARIIPGFSPVTFSNSQEMRLEDITKSSTLTVSCENTLQTTKHCDTETVSNSEDGIGSYRILVYTGNKLFSGTDANVHIEIFGEKGDTGILELKSSKRNWNKFERNKKDEFIFDISDVGELIKIRIGHDNSGLFGSSWFLDRVEVESKLLGKLWRFPYRHWLSKEKHGCNLEAELYPHEVINVSANDLSGSERDCDQSDVTDGCVKASGHGLENQLTVNSTTSFLVDVSEADPGNLLLLSVQGPTEPCQVNMTYEGNGIYNVSYQPQEKGVHIISIKWGKRHMTGSPFVVNVV